MYIVDESRSYDVSGRLEVVIRWLLANVERVTRPPKVRLEFDCAGSTVSAAVTVREKVEPAQLR